MVQKSARFLGIILCFFIVQFHVISGEESSTTSFPLTENVSYATPRTTSTRLTTLTRPLLDYSASHSNSSSTDVVHSTLKSTESINNITSPPLSGTASDSLNRTSPPLLVNTTGDLINRTSPPQLVNTTADLINRTSPPQLVNTTADLINRTSPPLLVNTTGDLINRTSPPLLVNTTGDLINRTSPPLLVNTTADSINSTTNFPLSTATNYLINTTSSSPLYNTSSDSVNVTSFPSLSHTITKPINWTVIPSSKTTPLLEKGTSNIPASRTSLPISTSAPPLNTSRHPISGAPSESTVDHEPSSDMSTGSPATVGTMDSTAETHSHIIGSPAIRTTASAVSNNDYVPGWAIALLVLAVILLLLHIILLILLSVQWCGRPRPYGFLNTSGEPVLYNDINHGTDIPTHSTHSHFEAPNGKIYEDVEKPRKNRTGMYVVNK